MDEINEIPLDSSSLKKAIETAKADIQNAVLDGDSELLLKLDSRIRILSARLFGSEVAETKKIIDQSNSDKIKIEARIELLREVKKQKNLALGRAQVLYQKRNERVNRAEFDIQIALNELESVRVLRRESNAQLQKFLDKKRNETSKLYNQYELSKY